MLQIKKVKHYKCFKINDHNQKNIFKKVFSIVIFLFLAVLLISTCSKTSKDTTKDDSQLPTTSNNSNCTYGTQPQSTNKTNEPRPHLEGKKRPKK